MLPNAAVRFGSTYA
jgi:hypothetical protein